MSLTIELMWQITGESLVQLFGGECQSSDTFQQHSRNLGSSAWALTGLPYPDLNMGIVSAEATFENAMSNVVQQCNAGKIPCLILSHGADDLCRAMGAQEVGAFPLMHLSANSIDQHEDDGGCKLATCDSEVQEGNLAVSSAFGLPGEAIDYAFGKGVPNDPRVRVYVAKRSNRVVCSLRISQVGSVAGLWCMATEAGLQHQGIGKKLLQYALLAEKKLGVQDFVLLATPDGFPLYSKVGFETKEQATAFLVGA